MSPEAVSSACVQCFPLHGSLEVIHIMHLYRHVRMRYGYVSLMLRSAVSCAAPPLGVILSWLFVARLEASQTFPSRNQQSARDFCEECGISSLL